MSEEKSDEGKGKGPLSNEAWSWITLLSGEINKEEMKLFMYWTACIVILIAFLSGAVAAGIAGFHVLEVVPKFSLFVMGTLFLGLTVTVWRIYKNNHRYFQKRVNLLIDTREAIISDKSTDFSEIRRKWKDYRKLLEKTEMDNANKKSEDEKEDLEKKDIKETLHRIETKIDAGKKFTCWTVFGSFLTATGLGVISISIKPDLDIVAAVSGSVMFMVGGVILSACYFNFKSNKKT